MFPKKLYFLFKKTTTYCLTFFFKMFLENHHLWRLKKSFDLEHLIINCVNRREKERFNCFIFIIYSSLNRIAQYVVYSYDDADLNLNKPTSQQQTLYVISSKEKIIIKLQNERERRKEFHDVNYYLNTESIKKKKITILFALISPSFVDVPLDSISLKRMVLLHNQEKTVERFKLRTAIDKEIRCQWNSHVFCS